MTKIKVAATQMACSWDLEKNLATAEQLVRDAAEAGANIILLQELFETPYFCQQEKYEYFDLATPITENRAISKFSFLAKELAVVIPISFFERSGNVFYNSLVVIDTDGKVLDTYRKTHIPDSHAYEEKFYFSPGDTGFKVWDTAYGKIGVGICWDQWFPETARTLTLMGADMLFFPTAIGSEPILGRDSKDHWQRTMQGHAAGNIVPVIASNRVGVEHDSSSMEFYGSSFITNEFGEILQQASRDQAEVIVAELDLAAARKNRRTWGVFRDRRPEMYKTILSMDAS